MNHQARKLAGATLLVTLLIASVAAAEGAPTRGEYVTQLEGICKPHSLATQRAVKGVKGDIQAERLKLAATKFSKAAKIFGTTVREISAVPRPSADEAKLAKWFGYLGQEETYLKKIASALHAGHAVLSQRYSAHFIRSGNLANDTVLAFGFNYCSFKPSRFE